MIHKIKLFTAFGVALTLGWLLFNSDTANAAGEKWELIDSTTIRVSGGSFTGPLSGNGFTIDNPRSITLKLKSAPNTDPSIWASDQSFNLGTVINGQPYYLEDTPRAAEQFCIVANNFSLLLSGREAASFSPIHREDCNKPFGEMRFIESGNSQYNRCGNWGPIQGSRCNTFWASSQQAALSLDSKISYNIPGKPLVCGDPGFVGPCPQPYDPAKADCTKTSGEAGTQRECQAIKNCITEADLGAATCKSAWEACVASYGSETPNYNSCESAISKGDLEGGKKPVDKGEEKDTTSCKPEGIGWILCPISNAIAGMTDGLFKLVAELMKVAPILGNEEYQKNLSNAWGTMRNIANIAFVIAFLIIIFSQLTSYGVSNYGIKKMLPRLIIAAILVNLSFYICAILVDLSNVLGVGLQNLLMGLQGQASLGSSPDLWSNLTAGILGGAGVVAAGFTYTVLAAPATLWAAVGGLLILMIPALFAIMIAFLVLILRQALIIILIIISPLAFVAYLLPNTESWYKKWQTSFVTLLFLFPLMSILFGGSQLAASFIMASAKQDTMIGLLMYMGALAVQVIPLFITPLLIKFSSGILGRFGGMVNNPNKGPLDRAKKGLQGSVDLSNKRGLAGNGRFGAIARMRDNRQRKNELRGKTYDATSNSNWQERVATNTALSNVNNDLLAQASRETEAKDVQRDVYSQALNTNPELLRTAAGLGGDKATTKIKAAVTAAQVKEFNENVAAEKTTMSKLNAADLNTIMRDTSLSEERRSAAAGQILKVGTDVDIHNTLDYLGTQAKDASGNFVDTAVSSIQQQVAADLGSRKPISMGAGDISNLNKGVFDGDFNSKIKGRLSGGKLSAQALAQAPADELDRIIGYVQANSSALKADPATADAMRALENDIAEFRTNPQLAGQQPAYEIASRIDTLHGSL